MLSRLCAALLVAILPLPALAAVTRPIEGLYGPEFTFTYDGNVSTEQRELYLRHLRRHLIENQPNGAKFTEGTNSTLVTNPVGNGKFTSPNGWWFHVTINPGVLEIKMSPLTVSETRRFKDDIQDAIFVSAANVGLFPWEFLGGGHINFDHRIFGGNLRLARNFIVDYWNHNELSMGVLSFDTRNALPLPLYHDDILDQIRRIIAAADDGNYEDNNQGVAAFLMDINTWLIGGPTRLGRVSSAKYHDVNLNHFNRIELRAVRPQANMDVWLNQIELIENRINNHLRFIDKPLPFNFRVPVPESRVANSVIDNQIFVPPIAPQAALRSFYQYVEEAQLDWKDHRGYIWPDWLRGGELEKFESSQFFKYRERLNRQKRLVRQRSCAKDLRENVD